MSLCVTFRFETCKCCRRLKTLNRKQFAYLFDVVHNLSGRGTSKSLAHLRNEMFTSRLKLIVDTSYWHGSLESKIYLRLFQVILFSRWLGIKFYQMLNFTPEHTSTRRNFAGFLAIDIYKQSKIIFYFINYFICVFLRLFWVQIVSIPFLLKFYPT